MDAGAAISLIMDGVYLSGAKGATDHPFVLSKDVKMILTFWDKQPELLNMPFYHDIDVFNFRPKIITAGKKKGTIIKYIDIVYDKIIEATKTRKGAVLLCCEGGNNYSAAFVIAFIMKLKHIQYDDAKTFVRERRRVVRLSQTMKDNLLQYEDILFPELIVEKPKTAPPVAAASYDSDSDNED
ncbi:dual specificity protein phosphatase 14-like [Convolutriloba macropyga]|uniref:dual specificity protein phosphatase 14-like n=1 Tax=Convolutriloba macropyga TaxID=536237 RepID=UPI003F521938